MADQAGRPGQVQGDRPRSKGYDAIYAGMAGSFTAPDGPAMANPVPNEPGTRPTRNSSETGGNIAMPRSDPQPQEQTWDRRR